MESKTLKIRKLDTLTSGDIIGMVDVLAFCTRTIAGTGDMRYRKIEAKLAPANDQLTCRVTFAESITDARETLAFIIEPLADDIIIKPVNRQKFTQKVIDEHEVNSDFGLLDQSLKENYLFFADQLQFWAPDENHCRNPKLSGQWYTVEEYSLQDSELSELV